MNTMKRIFMFISVLALVALAVSCQDPEPTPQFKKSDADFAVTPSTSSVAVLASDSLNNVISFTWDDPKYAVGLERSKFTIRVGATGSNFSKIFQKDFSGVLTGALLGRELNGMALALGGVIGEPISLDVVVIASQLNNNEPKKSNTITITVIPFADLALSASTTVVVLSSEMASEIGLQLNWTSAFNGFSAVKTYQFQYAKGGTGFANPVTMDVTTFTRAFTHKELNDLAFGYGFAPEEEGTIDFRIKANNEESGAEVYSNVITLTVSPYATSFPSIYGMGQALKGWGPWPDNAVEFPSSEFKKYETIAYFNNNEAFRFFEQPDWGPSSYNYPYFTSVDPLFENANDGDLNLRFIGTSGWYKINVDLNAKTVTMAAATEPLLFMVGAAVGGWDQSLAVKMNYIKPGVFKATTNFVSDTFRFFAQNDWGPTSYNYPYFTAVDPKFENGLDGDSNLKFIGTPGVHTITVDLNARTVIVN